LNAPLVLLVSGPAAGGIRGHLEALARGLPPREWRVAAALPPAVRLEAPIPRLPLDLGDRPRPLADARALLSLRAAAASLRPDLVHAHGVKAGLLALAAGLRAPVVVTFHNLWRGGLLTLPARLLLPRAAALVAVSGAVAGSLAAGGARSA